MNLRLDSSLLYITAFTLAAILVCGLLLIFMLVRTNEESEDIQYSKILINKINYGIEYFEEFSISIFTIMAGAYIYYYIDRSTLGKIIMGKYSSIIQIILIIISIIVMNLLSMKFNHSILPQEKMSLRLIGSIYSVINIIIIREIIDSKELDTTIICYIGLVLGRFIFFDTTIETINSEFKNIGIKAILFPIMGLIVVMMFFIYKKNGINIMDDNILLQFVIIYCGILIGLKTAKNLNTKLYL